MTLSLVESLGLLLFSAATVMLVSGAGCERPHSAIASEPAKPADNDNKDEGKKWAANCNSDLLKGEFAVERGPVFDVSPEVKARIEQVVAETHRGYGGTLVTSPADTALDSPAFLSRYLREFSAPVGGHDYDYHFERILTRLSGAETVLDDPRLDWDIWRSYLVFEEFVAAGGDGNEFKEGNSIHNLDGAKDLLWWYLDRNAEPIRKDSKRLAWWIDKLTDGMRAPGGRPMRRWYLLQLVAATDTKTAGLMEKEVELARMFPRRTSDPFDPFIETADGVSLLLGKDDVKHPPFLETLTTIARSQKLSYDVWGIVAKEMRPTRAVSVDLMLKASQVSFDSILGQESWSEKPQEFSVSMCRPIGRRSQHYNVRLPTTDSADGVYFFTYDAKLYVWPKKEMDNAAIQMLHLSKLIDDKAYAAFTDRGFKKLETTASGK